MKKVHITFVGGQPIPVYYVAKNINPDKIIYIYSNRTFEEMQLIRDELKEIETEEILLDAVLPQEIKKCAEKLAAKYFQDEVTVNISSGTKSWSYWFGVIFDRCENATILYLDQNSNLWNYKTLNSVKLTFDMPINFRLQGNPINNYTEYGDYTEADFKAIEEIENIRRFDNNTFNELVLLLTPEKRTQIKASKGKIDSGESYVEWDRKNTRVDIYIIKKNGKSLTKTLVSPHVIDLAFNTGWFELKVAKMISRWQHAKKIYMNCRFPSAEKQDKNEVDIIVDTGEKVLFVECKTQIKTSTDIDKFRSVVKKYGGMGSKALFVTHSDMSELSKEKCEEYRIIHFSMNEDLFGLGVEKTLYYKLDQEFKNLNTR